jgi:hypothetical protein
MSTVPDRTTAVAAIVSGLQLPQTATADQARFNRAVKDWIELRAPGAAGARRDGAGAAGCAD